MTNLLPRAQRTSATYALGLTFTRDGAHVELFGEIDLLAADDLAKLMESLHMFDMTIHVDVAAVSFIDTTGLVPLMEASRRRRQWAVPRLRIGRCSPSARLLLDACRLDGRPCLDLQAWDQLAANRGIRSWQSARTAGPF